MAEGPIKLFSTRAERYPEPTGADVALGAGRAALAAIPFVGGSITEGLSLVLAPAVARRRDTWFKELADGLEEAERRIEGFSIENLVQDEVFVSAVIQATRAAIGTHQREKREVLRNAVLNVALNGTPDEEKLSVFWSWVEAFTPIQLLLLRYFDDRGGFAHASRVELMERRAVTDPMVLELNSRGLLKDPRPYVARNRDSDQSLLVQDWTVTPIGKEFLAFVAVPERLR